MKKNKIENGAILSLKLDFDLGITFLKVVDFDELSNVKVSPGMHLCFYSYDYILKDIKNFNLEDFKKAKELVGPILTADIYYAIRKKYYTKVGVCPLREYEKNIPAMKDFSTPLFSSIYEKDAHFWKYFVGGIPYTWIGAPYEHVSHLEGNTTHSYDEMATRLSMEIIRRKGENVEDYYDINIENNAILYYNMMFTTNFNEVPDNMKGVVGKLK